MAPPFGKSDISNQLIRDSYQYVLQASDEGVMYRINGDFLVNPIFTSGITIYTGFTFVDGNQQPGYILTSDGSGNASWQPVSAATPSSGVTSITVNAPLSASPTTGAVVISLTESYVPVGGGTMTGRLNNEVGITVTGDVTSNSVVTGNLSADTISASTLTIVNSTNITSGSITANTYSGDTIVVNYFTAVTVSATTYYNLPESADTKVTGFSLTNNVITLSQNRTDEYSAFTISLSAYTGSSSTSGAYLPLSGGTVTGDTVFQSGITATTISATTYYNLPDNVTGKYLPLSGGTVTGNTIFQSGLTTNTLTITGITSSTDSNVVTIDNSGILHTYPISGLTGNTTSGNDGANSGRWILDNITSPPNPNYFYTTSTDFSALTSVDISITASTNADYYYWFALMQLYRGNLQDGFLQIQEVGNTNNTGNYLIQTVTNNTTYFTITLVYASSNGTFINGNKFTISYVFNGGSSVGGGPFLRNETNPSTTDTITINQSIFNPSNLTVLSTSVFIVDTNADYYILGDLYNNGSIIVNGTLKVGGIIYNYGTITGSGIIE
jgi:hypothetical protein